MIFPIEIVRKCPEIDRFQTKCQKRPINDLQNHIFATKCSFSLHFSIFIENFFNLVFQIKPGQISGQIPTKSCLKMNDGRLENNGRVPYGAYNQANAKLVTADGDYPSNYEHYSNFEPKKPTGIAHARNPGILKGLSRIFTKFPKSSIVT